VFDVNLGIAEVQAIVRDASGKFFGPSHAVFLFCSLSLYTHCVPPACSHVRLAEKRVRFPPSLSLTCHPLNSTDASFSYNQDSGCILRE
jgi:hypothetical protein